MNKYSAITLVALVALVAIVAVASASGYGGMGGYGGGYSQPSYGQNYERKTGFKTVSTNPSLSVSLSCGAQAHSDFLGSN